MSVAYRKRENLFEKGEREWRVEDDALVCLKPDGGEKRFAWKDVTALRVRFYPTMAKPWLHQLTLDTRHGRVSIDNGHFCGIASFEDRSASYAPFVRAALERVRLLAPNASVHVGSMPGAFWGQLIFIALAMIALAAVLLLLPLPAPFPFVAIVKLGVIVYGLAMLPRWIRRNWPRDGNLASALAELPE